MLVESFDNLSGVIRLSKTQYDKLKFTPSEKIETQKIMTLLLDFRTKLEYILSEKGLWHLTQQHCNQAEDLKYTASNFRLTSDALIWEIHKQKKLLSQQQQPINAQEGINRGDITPPFQRSYKRFEEYLQLVNIKHNVVAAALKRL